MRVRSIALAGTFAASLMGFSQSVAGDEAPTPVAIAAHPCAFAPVETGTWEASGAIEDSGTYVRTEAASSPPDRPPFTTGPIREEFIFTSSLGTFTVKAEERLTDTAILGVWQIKSGTGAYADTSGHGDDIAFLFDPTHENSCPDGFKHFTFALGGVAKKVS